MVSYLMIDAWVDASRWFILLKVDLTSERVQIQKSELNETINMQFKSFNIKVDQVIPVERSMFS